MRRWPRLAFACACVATSACGAASVPAQLKSPSKDGQTRVELKAAANVELWREAPGPDAFVCAAPCKATVTAGGQSYQARVRDMPDSPAVELPASQRVVIKVETAPPVFPGLGTVISTVGATTMVIGGVLVLADQAGNPELAGTTLGGAITAAAGSAVLAAGLVFVALSGTRVEVLEATRSGVLRF